MLMEVLYVGMSVVVLVVLVVDDYWMRIPTSAVIMPMKDLDFESWRSNRKPIEDRKLPKYRDLITKPVKEFINSNTLCNVPVERAIKSGRLGSATLISGSLYSRLIQYAGSTDKEPGYSAAPSDVLLAL